MSNQLADKRSVSTDALDTLGMLHFKEEYRDAIHLAVEPVVAGSTMKAGDYINIIDGIAHIASNREGMGIVDPFLTQEVKEGDRFWFIMKPRLIQSLRHVWSHPSFPDKE